MTNSLTYVTIAWLEERYPLPWPDQEEVVRSWACPRCKSLPGEPCLRAAKRGGKEFGRLHPLRWFVALDQNGYSAELIKE